MCAALACRRGFALAPKCADKAGMGDIMENTGKNTMEGNSDAGRMKKIASKKASALTAVLILASVLTGCGSKKYLSDIKAADYVTLGNYLGIEAAAPEPSVEDELVDLYIEYYILPEYITTVEIGDTANIDFVGYLDGEPFEGGAGKGTDLTIGSGQFIDGFEEGLVGVDVGETVSLNLAFPDPYKVNPDLSGAPVVFDVTVNRIVRPITPQPTDDFIASLGIEDCKTWKELQDYSYDTLYERATQIYESTIETTLADKVMADCTFKEPPAEMVERFKQNLKDALTTEAAIQGMTLAAYMQTYGGMTVEAYESQFQADARKAAQQYIMLQAIADVEGLNPTDEQVQEEIADRVEAYHYDSEEEYRKSNDVEMLKEQLMEKNVLDFLKENGDIQMTSVIED